MNTKQALRYDKWTHRIVMGLAAIGLIWAALLGSYCSLPGEVRLVVRAVSDLLADGPRVRVECRA